MKKTLSTILGIAVIVTGLTGCDSVQPTSPAAAKVLVTPNAPPKGCKYLGAVVGNQGNFFTGGFTSNKNLEEGSFNDLRNKAANLGGNYVQVLSNRAGVTGGGGGSADGFGGGSEETNVVANGNVYKCPPAAIGE